MSTLIRSSCDTCAWTGGPYRTQRQADFAYRQHSCDRWLAKAAAKARGQQIRAAVDRTPQPCLHPKTSHQHGTHACYVLDRCRCHPCAKANTAYERARSRAHAYGRFNVFVDAQPARDHVRTLQAAGLGLKTISTAAGISHSTITRLIYGRAARTEQRFEPPSTKLRRETADKILAVTTDAIAGGATINGIGSRRRLHALIAIGWSQTALADAMGYQLRNFGVLLNSDRDVTVKTGTGVRAVYEQLWNRPAPNSTRAERTARTRSLNYAAARGWAPPLAWDDDTIDDPHAQPDLGDADPNGSRGRSSAAVLEDIEFLLDDQPLSTAQQLAERLGVKRDAIQAACRRAGRDDLLHHLARNARLTKEGTAA